MFRLSEGNSGGILSIWRKYIATLIEAFQGEGGVEKTRCVLINVYSKCDLSAKRRLWDNLIREHDHRRGGVWCVVGDFNVVRRRDERKGVNEEASTAQVLEMFLFNNFLLEMELEDLNILGRRFTWYHLNGRSISRIDRMLISDEWAQVWGENTLSVLPRDVFDHCPLVLKNGGWSWGPTPFRFNNFRLNHSEFKGVVKEAWRNQNIPGWMSFVLKEKLKGLKIKIKEWNKVEYGGMEERVESLVEVIRSLDEKGEEGVLSELDVSLRKAKFEKLWRVLKAKDALIAQRSKSRWLKEGDANSKFFHKCLKLRKSRNSIKALKEGDGWVVSPFEVRLKVVNYFTNHFADNRWEQPKLDGVNFSTLEGEDNNLLLAPFSIMEIEVVVKDSDGNKSLGPNGFNFAFVKEFWYLMKDEVRIMFDEFHANEVLPKCMLAFFVTLIPKVSSPMELKDFRPIYLLGSLYKLLAKVLARRLAGVMNSIISLSQSAFLKGRHLVDGVLVVNELVDFAKKIKKECLIFKVDFEKVYDSVDWGFLEYIMCRVGLCAKWVAWMKACVFGGSMSVLVNGSPTKEICINRGLKQGDPLALFLFLLVAEGFSGLMRNAVDRNLFEGFQVGRNGLVISHLQYVDDTLCIGKPTVENLWALKSLLRGFEMVSGLKINFNKISLIGVNVDLEFMEMACNFLNCSKGSVPFKYLGLPVVETLSGRLNNWGHKYISFGGRIVLLNSVLISIPIFYMSLLKMAVQVCRRIVRIQREFLWAGVGGGTKISWVSWKSVCQQKCNGGVGVKDIWVMNVSLLAKWRWRLLDGKAACGRMSYKQSMGIV